MSVRGIANRTKTEQDTQKTTQKILDLIAPKPYITRNEMAIECAVTPDTIKLQIKNLKDKGIIHRVDADRGGYWEIINHSS